MAEDTAPKGGVAQVLEELNLPRLLAGPAGEALSRLVAGAADIPVEYLRRVSQGIKDTTDARTIVSKAVAEAAAALAKNDPEIVQRAAHNLLTKGIRHQANKERIAKKTAEILQEEPVPPSEANAQAKIDDDWFNVFERYAEQASSERLQETWARVLAGEIRAPRKFSIKTLRFIAELDQATAQLFEKHLPYVCGTHIFTPEPFSGQPFIDMLALQDAGLLSGVGGTISQTFTLHTHGMMFVNQTNLILINGPEGHTIRMPCVMVTKIGIELSSIVSVPFNMQATQEIVDRIPKEKITKISLARPNTSMQNGQILWEKAPVT